MADSSRAAAAEDGISSEESPTSVPRSFSYRLDTGPDLLGSRRSSSSSLLGSRHQSTDSLFGSRRSSGRNRNRNRNSPLPFLLLLWIGLSA
jgi:hypothetical protein